MSAEDTITDDMPAQVRPGNVARCSKGRLGVVTEYKELPWGHSWVGFALDGGDPLWASRRPEYVAESLKDYMAGRNAQFDEMNRIAVESIKIAHDRGTQVDEAVAIARKCNDTSELAIKLYQNTVASRDRFAMFSAVVGFVVGVAVAIPVCAAVAGFIVARW